MSAVVGIRRKEPVLIHFRDRVQPGINEMNCNAALKECVCEIGPLQISFLVIAMKLNGCYLYESYLYASNATADKGADPLSSETVNVPKH